MTGLPIEPQRRPDGAAFVIAALLAALGALLVVEGISLPDRGGYSGVGPGKVPLAVGLCLLGLAGWTVLAGLRGETEVPPRQAARPVLWVLGGLVAQLALLHTGGFTLASGALFGCVAHGFGARRLPVALGVGLVLAGAVYAVFDGLLRLTLPAGPVERLIFGG
ncbi:MAG: tripartite tricarboxylate transporter TctB family protein [Rhodobacterales bacterium]|nr:tripartite tricarboxylate transporter TctB family protein [Rhodobacterales bacterium]